MLSGGRKMPPGFLDSNRSERQQMRFSWTY